MYPSAFVDDPEHASWHWVGDGYTRKNITTTVDEMGLLEEEDGRILDINWDYGAGWSFEVELLNVTVGHA